MLLFITAFNSTPEDILMKKNLSTLIAALVAVSFSAIVFAADVPAPAAAPAAPAGSEMKMNKKEMKAMKKPKKVKKAKKTVKKEAAPAAK